ncbi:MAG: ATP-dependent 6-phosphofructokinase [Rheinheimera sp.]|uniref:ATP-dependent 6-phosphofructokinase n=1 Tax=Arsukibacterium sp. UBA3155 TaxID=1946058 RepID=UPI000C893113|nr:ATP-dependent 6-phosphofructokinase [Arsukibacterium sp. UBA3155]MAD74380.1 ATP-dependent 6-phosphofructokinase [Rheinheimera sp.]|tara:strand:- start:14215 stop:15210 length:996 start_codon:yes stop_codon:yes gene_type:complete
MGNIKRLAVLTSGGDAPGMNACIRAVLLTANACNIDVIGFKHGFNGLLEQEFQTLHPHHVDNIIQRGGTILKSARCPAMEQPDGPVKAAAILDQLNIDALIVIGGDGSFRGTMAISKHYRGQLIGVPGTIDNDVDGTDTTIGFATAIDTALDAIDKIRDTADAFERIFLVELMGRHSGYLSLAAGIAGGAEQIICPEFGKLDADNLNTIITPIKHAQLLKGKTSYLIVVAEHSYPGGVTALAEALTMAIGIECRACILGHIQRGGSPVGADRILATKLGAFAVEQLLQGANLVMAGEVDGEARLYPLAKTGERAKAIDPFLVRWQQQIGSF